MKIRKKELDEVMTEINELASFSITKSLLYNDLVLIVLGNKNLQNLTEDELDYLYVKINEAGIKLINEEELEDFSLSAEEISAIVSGNNFYDVANKKFKYNLESVIDLPEENVIEIISKEFEIYSRRMAMTLLECELENFTVSMGEYESALFINYSACLHILYAFELCMRVNKLDEYNSDGFNNIIKALLLYLCKLYVNNNYKFVENDYLRIQQNIVNKIDIGIETPPLAIANSLMRSTFNMKKVKFSIFSRKKIYNYVDRIQLIIIDFIKKYTEISK